MKKIFLFICLAFLLSCQTDTYTKEHLVHDYGETYPVISTIINTLDLDEREVHLLESNDSLGFSLKLASSEPILEKLSEDILNGLKSYRQVSINDYELILESDLNSLQISHMDEEMIIRINPVSKDIKAQLLTDKEKETIKEVLKILNTITEDDYFTSLDEFFNARDRSELVKDYFVKKPFPLIGSNTLALSSIYNDYYCTTEITDIELELRETSDNKQLVCYYSFTMTSNFIDVDAPPFTNVISGEMTLVKVDETYKIGHINTRSGEYGKSFLEHVDTHEINISEDGYSEYLKSLLAEKIYTGAETYQLSNKDDANSIVVFENSMIKLGYKGGEFIQSFTYKDLDYDVFEDSIVFHIVEEVEVFDEGNYTVSEVSYQDKLIINENEITYYHKYQSDDMIESHWPYVYEGTYYLMSDQEGILPSLTITDQEFTLSFDPLSSYFNTGTYLINGDKLILRTDDGKYHYTFEINDYELTFLMDESSSVKPVSEMGPSIEDKSIFSHLK